MFDSAPSPSTLYPLMNPSFFKISAIPTFNVEVGILTSSFNVLLAYKGEIPGVKKASW